MIVSEPGTAADTLTVTVGGVTRASSERHVGEALEQTVGVLAAPVNLATERVTVEVDPVVVGADAVHAALDRAGCAPGDVEALAPPPPPAMPAPTADPVPAPDAADGASPVTAAVALAEAGHPPVFVSLDGQAAGSIALADAVKPSARNAFRRFRGAGIEVALMTGDTRWTDVVAADGLGIDRAFAVVLPRETASSVKRLEDDGKKVATVDDGVQPWSTPTPASPSAPTPMARRKPPTSSSCAATEPTSCGPEPSRKPPSAR